MEAVGTIALMSFFMTCVFLCLQSGLPYPLLSPFRGLLFKCYYTHLSASMYVHITDCDSHISKNKVFSLCSLPYPFYCKYPNSAFPQLNNHQFSQLLIFQIIPDTICSALHNFTSVLYDIKTQSLSPNIDYYSCLWCHPPWLMLEGWSFAT